MPHRLFLYEPGWKVALKVGSEQASSATRWRRARTYYHRLLDGEVYLRSTEERLCLACAERRGLLSYRPKGLREPEPIVEIFEGPDDEPGSVYRRESVDLDRRHPRPRPPRPAPAGVRLRRPPAPNDAGYRRMGEAFDPKLFAR